MTHPHGLPPLPYTQLRLERQSAAAEVYSGTDQTGAPVTIAVLTAAGAADSNVRAAFIELAGSNSYTAMAGQVSVHASDLATARPWAANWQFPGQDGVEQWLSMLPTPTGAFAAMSQPAVMSAPPAMSAPPVISGLPATGAPVGLPTGRSGNRSAAAIVIAGGCAVLLIVGVVVAVALSNRGGGGGGGDKHPSASASASAVTSASASGSATSESASSSGTSASPDTSSGKPQLKNVTAVSLVGPTFAAGEKTFTMQFEGWPFAFRTPGTWGCMAGTIAALPDAKAWVCIDEGNTASKQKVNVMFRRCSTTCTSAERTDMNTKWFDAGTTPKAALDDRTWYMEADKDGTYGLDLSRFFGDKAGQPYKWQVGVSVRSPSPTREAVQKTLNDIISQTP